jgi:hypothetical protein
MEDVGRSYLAEGRDQLLSVVNMVMNLLVSYDTGDLLTD